MAKAWRRAKGGMTVKQAKKLRKKCIAQGIAPSNVKVTQNTRNKNYSVWIR